MRQSKRIYDQMRLDIMNNGDSKPEVEPR